MITFNLEEISKFMKGEFETQTILCLMKKMAKL